MITERSNVPVWSAVYVLNMGKTVLCINVMTKGWIAFDGKIKLHYTANWKVRYRGEFEMTHRVWIGCFCWYCMMFVVGILATWLVGSLVFSPNVPEGFLLTWKLYCGYCAVKWRPSFHTGYEAPFELSFTILPVFLNSCTRHTLLEEGVTFVRSVAFTFCNAQHFFKKKTLNSIKCIANV